MYVLRWGKDELPFWQDVDSGDRIEFYAVADIINERNRLKRDVYDEHDEPPVRRSKSSRPTHTRDGDSVKLIQNIWRKRAKSND